MKSAYRRVLIKLSGGQLAGESGFEPIWELAILSDGNPETTLFKRNNSQLPWWVLPEMRVAFLRPLFLLLQLLDCALWPNTVWAMHLLSLVWYGFACLLAGNVVAAPQQRGARENLEHTKGGRARPAGVSAVCPACGRHARASRAEGCPALYRVNRAAVGGKRGVPRRQHTDTGREGGHNSFHQTVCHVFCEVTGVFGRQG